MEEKQRKAQEQHERDNPKMGMTIFYNIILTKKSLFQSKVTKNFSISFRQTYGSHTHAL